METSGKRGNPAKWSNPSVHTKPIFIVITFTRGGVPHRGGLSAQPRAGNPSRWGEVLSVFSRVHAQGGVSRLAGLKFSEANVAVTKAAKIPKRMVSR